MLKLIKENLRGDQVQLQIQFYTFVNLLGTQRQYTSKWYRELGAMVAHQV